MNDRQLHRVGDDRAENRHLQERRAELRPVLALVARLEHPYAEGVAGDGSRDQCHVRRLSLAGVTDIHGGQ